MLKFFICLFFQLHILFSLNAHTIRVGKNHQIKSIAFALEQSNSMDTILVFNGLYVEKNLLITKPVFLIGKDHPILDGQFKYEVISVKSDHVTISGFTIKNSAVSSIVDYAGIKIYNSNFINISDNIIIDSFFGIYLQYASNCDIKNNRISAHGIIEQNSANGIHCWNSKNLRISNNEISGHRDGIYFEFVTNSKISDNRSLNNLRYGLHFMFSSNNHYISNTFENNGAGVAVMFSHHVSMYKNIFKNNWGDASYGLLLKEISDSKIISNIFFRNTSGVYMEGTSRIQVANNQFHDNGWGLKIQANCMDINVNKNNFIGNTFDVSTNGSLVLNNFNQNYWDKYEGYDLDHNKIGDIPYRPVSLFSVIIERNPSAMSMFRSIISVLMDKAEKILPSLTPEQLKDDFPRIKPFQL